VLDMSGLAQKFGPVMSHVRIAPSPAELHSVRVGTGAADLVLGCDLVVTSGSEALSKMNDKRSKVPPSTRPSRRPPISSEPRLAASRTDLQATSSMPRARKTSNSSRPENSRPLSWAMRSPPTCSCSVRVSERLGAACRRFAPARDRAERGCRRIQQEGLPVGRRAATDLSRVERLAAPAEIIPISQRSRATSTS